MFRLILYNVQKPALRRFHNDLHCTTGQARKLEFQIQISDVTSSVLIPDIVNTYIIQLISLSAPVFGFNMSWKFRATGRGCEATSHTF